MTEAFVYEAIRTPRGRGRAEGALAGVSPIALVGGLLRELVSRTSLDPSRVDDVVLGCVTQVGEQGTDVARMAVLMAGWPHTVPGATVSRFCTSGLDAVSQAAARVMAGMDDLVVAGGVESMSRVPMFADKGAWFADPAVAAGTRFVHMGVSADLIATLDGRSREELDAWAARSHHRAAAAWAAGHFDRAVVPVEADGAVLLAVDERIRSDITLESLAARPPAFGGFGQSGGDALVRSVYPEVEAVDHLHTSGSSPGIVDGASVVLVGSRQAGLDLGLEPLARVVSFAQAAVEPVIMLTGPVPATREALRRAGLGVDAIDLWETNESFSATVLHYISQLGLDPERVNVDGGAIAMGHPLGATGAMLVGTLVDALRREGGGRGVVSLCGGAGVAAAAVLEV